MLQNSMDSECFEQASEDLTGQDTPDSGTPTIGERPLVTGGAGGSSVDGGVKEVGNGDVKQMQRNHVVKKVSKFMLINMDI